MAKNMVRTSSLRPLDHQYLMGSPDGDRWRSIGIHGEFTGQKMSPPKKYPPNMVFHGVFHSF